MGCQCPKDRRGKWERMSSAVRWFSPAYTVFRIVRDWILPHW